RQVSQDEAGMRLDRWFREHYPGLAFGALNKLLRKGSIRIDGGRAKSNSRLAAGQLIRVPPLGADAMVERPSNSIAPQQTDTLSELKRLTLFEDDACLILNKPFGLAVQGGSGLNRHVDGMLEALRDRLGRKPRLVHRLDRDTSGVLAIAKTKAAATAMAASFRGRATRKIYWALVRGVPKPRQGRISNHLVKGSGDDGNDRMRIARHGEAGADHALTLYNVIETAGQRLTWLSLRPITGRTHQLRAHCNHIGHPIIGDPKYFDVENWEIPGGIQKRLHLHARRLVIPHPKGGLLDVTAPLPPHMQQSWNLLGLSANDNGQDDDWDS
ncbi:MAG: RluA family pseudouridine synthase, partial [Pseudomonadota bacterium]